MKVVTSSTFIVAHVAWFAANSLRRTTFERHPFSSPHASGLARRDRTQRFVFVAKDRITLQPDQRAHLELQINLMTELELPAHLTQQGVPTACSGTNVAKGGSRFDERRSHTTVRHLAVDTELESIGPSIVGQPLPWSA